MRPNVPDYIREYNDRAQEYERLGRYNESIEVYRQALARHPDIAVLHNNLGTCLANQREYQEAKNEFLQAIKLTQSNRRSGIIVPDSYPDEPEQNLRAVEALIKGTKPGPLPARAATAGSPLQSDPFLPGMSFPHYVFWFITRSLFGWLLMIAAVIVTGVFWYNDSPYYPTVLGASCFIILVFASIAYTTGPRLGTGGPVMWFMRPNVDRLLRQQDLPGLLKALGHSDSMVRESAVHALIELGRSSAAFALGIASRFIGQELTENDSDLQTAAVDILVGIGTDVISPLLTSLTIPAVDAVLRDRITEVLVEIGRREPGQTLLEIESRASRRPDPTMLSHVIRALKSVREGLTDVEQMRATDECLARLGILWRSA